MKREYADFLEILKHELLTQPTDGNCDPRFWGIKERKRDYGFTSENADGWEVFDGEMCERVGKPDDIQSVIDEFTEYFKDAEYPINWRGVDKSDIDEVVERANNAAADARDEDHHYKPFDVVYYVDRYEVNEDAVFLTKAACEEHIRKYGYNYAEPHTYVMTADRCPEYETLLKIIKETDWKGETTE